MMMMLLSHPSQPMQDQQELLPAYCLKREEHHQGSCLLKQPSQLEQLLSKDLRKRLMDVLHPLQLLQLHLQMLDHHQPQW